MPENTPVPPPVPPGSSQPTVPEAATEPIELGAGPGINIGEEFGTAKKNLPPAKIVAIALGAAAVVLGVVPSLSLARAQAVRVSGARRLRPGLRDQHHVLGEHRVPDQNAVLVAINVTVRNSGQKALWIHDIKAKLKTDSGELTDEAASAVDFDRYFQAFPTLKEHAIAALPPEAKIPPGGQAQGTIVVSFPVKQDAFDKRKSLSIVIQPYDQPLPLVLTK